MLENFLALFKYLYVLLPQCQYIESAFVALKNLNWVYYLTEGMESCIERKQKKKQEQKEKLPNEAVSLSIHPVSVFSAGKGVKVIYKMSPRVFCSSRALLLPICPSLKYLRLRCLSKVSSTNHASAALNSGDHKAMYQYKSNWDLLRSLLILKICSVNFFVDNSLTVRKILNLLLIKFWQVYVTMFTFKLRTKDGQLP